MIPIYRMCTTGLRRIQAQSHFSSLTCALFSDLNVPPVIWSGCSCMAGCHEWIVPPSICLRKRALVWVMATATHQLFSLAPTANARVRLTSHMTNQLNSKWGIHPQGHLRHVQAFPLQLSCPHKNTLTHGDREQLTTPKLRHNRLRHTVLRAGLLRAILTPSVYAVKQLLSWAINGTCC